MVKGFDNFKNWFRGYENQYTIIGGTACDILMTEEGMDFRATKDIDLVLIFEAITPEFGRQFWDFIRAGEYQHCNKSTGVPQFYRFTNPNSSEYPTMIELFSRKVDTIQFPDDAVLTPLPIDDDISSLSAILLDDDYYDFLQSGRKQVDGVTVLGAEYLIPFKAKAWIDLSDRKANGEQVDSKNVKKHRNDVFRLTELVNPETRIVSPHSIVEDMGIFISRIQQEELNLKQLGIVGRKQADILSELKEMYIE